MSRVNRALDFIIVKRIFVVETIQLSYEKYIRTYNIYVKQLVICEVSFCDFETNVILKEKQQPKQYFRSQIDFTLWLTETKKMLPTFCDQKYRKKKLSNKH